MQERSAFRQVFGALVVAGMLAMLATPATPAAAAAPTACVGTIEHKAIIGDVIVNPGNNCSLRKVSITGSVTIMGQMWTESVTIGQSVVIENGALSAKWTTARGDITLNGADLSLDASTLVGSLVGSPWGGWVLLKNSKVNGRVAVSTPEGAGSSAHIGVFGTTIGQGLRTDGLTTHVWTSRVGKYLVVNQTNWEAAVEYPVGASICSSDVAGDVTLISVRSPQIGASRPEFDCVGPVTVTGSLLLLQSKRERALVAGSFGGQLVCRNNSLLPQSGPGGVTAIGYIQQCAGLRPV